MTEIFFDPLIFLADDIKLSMDIPNIALGEVPLLRGLLWEPKCTPKSQIYANFNMVKNAAPELNMESDMMGHLFLMG